MATSSLLKSYLHNSIAEAVYNEIQNRSARYYYFLGKTIAWNDDLNPPYPVDSFAYELDTRKEIITMKEIKSTDVAFIISRVDWTSGTIYDMYDDQYSDEVQGINLISGGSNYSNPPIVTISGGGGTGATAVATINGEGVVVEIQLTSRGRNYTSAPTVTISGAGGVGASATAVVTIGYSGARKIEDTNSYVLTDEYHVYKCLDNNKNATSTYKPVGTVVDPVIMPDGYMWKYLYSIPIALRNKFLTDTYMPVVNSLRSQFYSGGELSNVIIESGGKDYTFANISVSGDGYRESDPSLLQYVQISSGGSGYTSGANVVISPPFTGANAWAANDVILLGQRVEHNNNIYQAARSGTLAAPAPTHKSGIVANGTAALEYIGSRATGTVNVSGGGEVTGVTLNGSIYEINITAGGVGYTTAPTVTLIGGGGSGFVGGTVMRGTSVSKVVISNSGDNYTTVPTVRFGTAWSSEAETSLNDQIFSGNRLYTVTSASTTPIFDISKASYTGKSVSVTDRDTAPAGITFSTDGTKMFILGDTSNNVVVYNLSTAWDVSTGVFAYESPSISESTPTGIAFSPDGLKMFIVGSAADAVREYGLTDAWTIPPVLPTPISFSISQDTLSGGLAFSADGIKMWIAGAFGDAVYEYTLSTPFSISTASFTTSFSIQVRSTAVSDICFSANGKNMLIVDSTTDIIHQYTLGTANSIATAVFTNSFFVGGLETTPTGIFLHPTNSFFYVVGTVADAVYQYENLPLFKLGTEAPTHPDGTATNGNVGLTYVGTPAAGTAVLKYGSGYSLLPTVQFQPVSAGSGAIGNIVQIKSEAKLLPLIDGGQIVGVQIDNGGIGYTYANLTVSGNGSQASLTADLSPGDIDTLQANTELLTPNGRIMAYPIISGGYGYGTVPTITIDGDGTGAVATAVVHNGAVTKINVSNYGLGYTWATVTITGGGGTGATARAVLAPYGGHGKDAINGMFSRTLMFYTNISRDTNQGFAVNNDFRQFGIIKNPRQFNNVGLLKSGLSSACYVVTGVINTANFTPDMDLFLGLQERKFRIVAVTSTAALIQSLDNAAPAVGSVFVNSNNQQFIATGVTLPTADKYSGDLLFIDNKQAFTPTADQTVTLRTIIKF